jgi:flagellar basal body rod protein FlgC
MGFCNSLDIVGSALTAERFRTDIITQNIANEKTTSNATQRKRKERLNDKKKELTHDQFKQRYGAIDKIVNSSLKQMSNINDTLTNISDTNKLTNANDVTKVKTTTKRGHHDGEELSNGTLHYFK